VISVIVTNMSQQPAGTDSGSGGASAQGLSTPQARTAVRALLDLVIYTADNMHIHTLRLDHGTLRLVGRMRLITQDFLAKVTQRGWVISSIAVSPQATLEVVMTVDILDDNTPATQQNEGVNSDNT